MPNCFYHPQAESVVNCMGCKMPICGPCRDEGQRGYCEKCMKKVASLGAKVADMKKTGMVNAQKATMIKTAGKPTGLRNITYCFHHFDAVASGTCPTCNRPFCLACMNQSGLCTHCAAQAEEAQAEAPAERPQAPARELPQRRPVASRAPAKKQASPMPLVLGGIVVLLLMVVAGMAFHRPAAHTPIPAQAVDPQAVH